MTLGWYMTRDTRIFLINYSSQITPSTHLVVNIMSHDELISMRIPFGTLSPS